MQQISDFYKYNKSNKIPVISWPASVPSHSRTKIKVVLTELLRLTFLLIYSSPNIAV